jgi:disease resistance protein RPM1
MVRRVQEGAATPSKRSAKRFIKKIINIVNKARTRREVAQEIKGIKERVREVAERRDRLEINKRHLLIVRIFFLI